MASCVTGMNQTARRSGKEFWEAEEHILPEICLANPEGAVKVK